MEEKKNYTIDECIELLIKWNNTTKKLILTGSTYKLAQTIATQNGLSENDEVEVTIGDKKEVMIPAEMYKKSIATAEEHDKIYAEVKTALLSCSYSDSAICTSLDKVFAKLKTQFFSSDEKALDSNFDTSLAKFKANFLADSSTPITKEKN